VLTKEAHGTAPSPSAINSLYSHRCAAHCDGRAHPDFCARIRGTMLDLVMVALVAVAFALAVAYAHLCSRMLPPAADRDIGP
jgi:hypothetical protein